MNLTKIRSGCMLCLVLGVPAASADTITFTSTSDFLHVFSGSQFSTDPVVTQFDPSLGTLTAVDVQLTATPVDMTSHVQVSRHGPGGPGVTLNVSFAPTEFADVLLPGGDLLFNYMTFNGGTVTGSTNATTVFQGTGFGGGGFPTTLSETDSVDLAAFTGLGTITLPVAGRIEFGGTDVSSFLSNNTLHRFTATWLGSDWDADVTLDVTYDYDPIQTEGPSDSVPEPATLLMVGSTLVVFARRLRAIISRL